MLKDKILILIIVMIILTALFNALIEADLVEFSGSEIKGKDQLRIMKKGLEEIEIEKDKGRYNKEEFIDALVSVGFKVSSEGSLTRAISQGGRGDISIDVIGEKEINSIHSKVIIRESKKEYAEVSELYFKKICRMLDLPIMWEEESLEKLRKLGKSDNFTLENYIEGNNLSIGYNKRKNSFDFDVIFTN